MKIKNSCLMCLSLLSLTINFSVPAAIICKKTGNRRFMCTIVTKDEDKTGAQYVEILDLLKKKSLYLIYKDGKIEKKDEIFFLFLQARDQNKNKNNGQLLYPVLNFLPLGKL